MKTVVFFMLLTCCFLPVKSQEFSTMPQVQRDSVLVELAKKSINQYYPDYYEKYILLKPSSLQPIIEERKIIKVPIDPYNSLYGTRKGDIFYVITFPYEEWYNVGFAWDYLAKVKILNKCSEVVEIGLGISGMFRNIRMEQIKDSLNNP